MLMRTTHTAHFLHQMSSSCVGPLPLTLDPPHVEFLEDHDEDPVVTHARFGQALAKPRVRGVHVGDLDLTKTPGRAHPPFMSDTDPPLQPFPMDAEPTYVRYRGTYDSTDLFHVECTGSFQPLLPQQLPTINMLDAIAQYPELVARLEESIARGVPVTYSDKDIRVENGNINVLLLTCVPAKIKLVLAHAPNLSVHAYVVGGVFTRANRHMLHNLRSFLPSFKLHFMTRDGRVAKTCEVVSLV